MPYHYKGKDIKGYPKELYEKIRNILDSTNESEAETAAEEMIGFLEKVHPNQFLLQNYLMQIMIELEKKFKLRKEKIPEAEEILVYCRSYKDIGNVILSSCIACLGKEKEVGTTKCAKERVNDIREFLDENYDKPLSNKEISEKFGYNEKYLSTLFKDCIGVSPSKYIVLKKIEKAKYLIELYPDKMLKKIAQEVGYEDPLYFSRVFREVVSVSPKAYAESVRKSK